MEVSDAFRILNTRLSTFISKHHFAVFLLLAFCAIVATSWSLYSTLSLPNDKPNVSTSASFDTKTIQKIQQLSTSTSAQSTSGERTNPF